MKMPSEEIAQWLREALKAAVDATVYQRRQRQALSKRRLDLKGMEGRLLDAYLAGMLDEDASKAKSAELKSEASQVAQSLANPLLPRTP